MSSSTALPDISSLSLSVLPSLTSTVNSLILTLSNPSSSSSSSSTSTPASAPLPLPFLRADLEPLIKLTTKEVTSIGIAVKPPISSTTVVEAVLKNVEGLLAKLKFLSTGLVGRKENVGSWAKEMRWALLEYLESLQHFLTLLPSSLPPSPSPTKQTRQLLLNSLSKIYSLSSPEALFKISNSPIEAAKKVWKEQKELIDDSLKEFNASASTSTFSDGAEGSQSGSGKGKGKGKRREGVKSLIGLGRGLVARLLLRDYGDECEEVWLETVTRQVMDLVESGDDLVGVFEDDVDDSDGEEEVEAEDEDEDEEEEVDVDEEVEEYVEKAKALVSSFEEIEDEKVKKWVEMWRVQLVRVLGEIRA